MSTRGFRSSSLVVVAVVAVLAPVLASAKAPPAPVGYEAFRQQARSASLRDEIEALARTTLRHAVAGRPLPAVPRVRQEALRHPAGIFVTLVKRGEVRGCMGALEPVLSTAAADVMRAAALACTEDLRYRRLRASEVDEVDIVVSVVGPRRRAHTLGELSPLRLGLLVQGGGRAAVLLPGEALSPGWQVAECKRKAGIPARAEVLMYTFPTVTFGSPRRGSQ